MGTAGVASVVLLFTIPSVAALDNGAAITPPRGWQSWNAFHMTFNASLFLEMAAALADPSTGLLAAGFDLISDGGSTFPHQGLPPWYNGTNESNFRNVIVRNETGYYQIDPARFPGPGSTAACLDAATRRACLAEHRGDPVPCGCVNGNGGMAAMIKKIKKLGFRWGSYSNEAGCEVAACNTTALNASRARGFVDQDAELFFDEWGSDYVMVDSVGSYGGLDRPYPKSDPRWWNYTRYMIGLWSEKVDERPTPTILHSCHSGCSSRFSGPTLMLAPCDSSDTGQLWSLPPRDALGCVHDAGTGLCIGCNDFASDCANDAARFSNGSGHGLGMAACAPGCSRQEKNQQWNLTSDGQLLTLQGNCLEARGGPGDQVVSQPPRNCRSTSSQQWTVRGDNGAAYSQLASAASPDKCLAAGPQFQAPMDPFCAEAANMWRSSTDTLQVWGRLMAEVESLVGMGTVSGPGHWAFADSLELGVPGGGVLTWEESKSHLGLYAITSQPLFASNDVRPGYVQPRLLDMLRNKMMLSVNDAWAGNAGDRIWTAAVGKEVWAKPLPGHQVAALVFNRNGTTSRCNVVASIDCPCDDNQTESSGKQDIVIDYRILPKQWLLDDGPADGSSFTDLGAVSCDLIDIFGGANAGSGVSLGTHTGRFQAEQVPPHGSRFLLLGNCTTAK